MADDRQFTLLLGRSSIRDLSIRGMSRHVLLAVSLGIPLLTGGCQEQLLAESPPIGEPTFLEESSPTRELAKELEAQFNQHFERMSTEAKRGFSHLLNAMYLPPDFDQEIVEQLAEKNLRPHPLSDFTGNTTGPNRYLSLFGVSPRPSVIAAPSVSEGPGLPLQYVVANGQYVMNCFACHGGNLFGAPYPGAPNTSFLLSSLTDEVRMAKVRAGKPLTHMDVGSLAMPLGETIGTSNAVMFGVALMHFRDADLNVLPQQRPAPMRHHDMDAPAWWTFHRKSHIYIDGFAEKGHRGLMQFMLLRKNGPEKFREWENDFRDIYAFLEELRPPKYPYPIDEPKRVRGEELFSANCASCHGTYGENPSYPQERISLEKIGTDPVRGESLTSAHRQKYADSWFADYGKQKTIVELDGYVAPPLDGIWASAPYFHNGSVPTLWHVMHPESRPKVWRRVEQAPDLERIGFRIAEFESVPKGLPRYDQRLFFDTAQGGKSAAGHDFFGQLTEEDKSDLLEYLKTL